MGLNRRDILDFYAIMEVLFCKNELITGLDQIESSLICFELYTLGLQW